MSVRFIEWLVSKETFENNKHKHYTSSYNYNYHLKLYKLSDYFLFNNELQCNLPF